MVILLKNKPKLIIVEGAQGSGKSTICRHMREKMTSTLLLSLSGVADKTKEGAWKSYEYHSAFLNTLFDISNCGLNTILERSYLSERVYAKLGIKPYTFEEQTKALNCRLRFLATKYDVHLFILTCAESEYEARLQRDKGSYVGFSVQSSLDQQDAYLSELKNIEETYPSINCYVVDNTTLTAEETAEHLISTVLQKK